MNKAPFRRFVTTFLLFNKNVEFIVNKLHDFGYNVSDVEVERIFKNLKSKLPEKYASLLDSGQIFPMDEGWLKELGVFEFYDFIVRGGKIEDPPEYFKWCEDCMWAHKYKDVMSLINVLLFNDEDLESISKIVAFKYKKKIGIDALNLYKRVFWDLNGLTAKDALHYCVPFRDNAMIIRKMRSGNELEMLSSDSEANDGSDISFGFHDTSYIKWKIGYRDIEVPTPKDFLERIKQDSYFKYYEAMNMTQSIEIEDEDGSNDKLGAFNSSKRKRRNVEEQRAKMAKQWMDIYLKAQSSIPSDRSDEAGFFEKMEQLSLDFQDEKLVQIDDMPDIMNDIKEDMSQ